MKVWNRVAIVGVGLIGASVGLALRKRGLAQHVLGIGRRSSTLDAARECGAITESTRDLAAGVSQAELIVVCTPVDTVVEQVRKIAEAAPPGALITDAGSTKAAIVASLQDLPAAGARFVGSHPLAGSEKTGPEHGQADLFEGRAVIVTPADRSQGADVEAICDFWRSLGARVTCMDAEQHDVVLARTSHLPHLVSSALAVATLPEDLPLTAGGWRDATRIAGGDPALWEAILRENRANVLKSLDAFETTLKAFRAALANDSPDTLHALLSQGKQTRDAWTAYTNTPSPSGRGPG